MTSLLRPHGGSKRSMAVALPALLLVAATLLLATACSNAHKNQANSSSGNASSTASGTAAAASATSTSILTPSGTPDPAPLAALMLPRFNVTANVEVKGVDPATNTMQSPDNKDDVAYYDFTPKPGFGCEGPNKCANTVIAGHVDWYTGQTGVFWHLKDLTTGDKVELKLADGTLYTYKVVSNTVYKSNAAPVNQIIGDTPQESVTLITCDGVFNKTLQEYNARRVVRAVRVS